jgi:predicted  nucleic acid-binding Zn-ribbon protein
MGELRQLYLLQQIDKELSEKNQALEQVECQLSDTKEMDNARASLVADQQRLETLEKAQQPLEWDIQDLKNKIKGFNTQLYGGKTSNHKELIAIQQEVEMLKERQKGKEDQVLDIMVEVEAAQAQVKAKSGELETIEKEWQRRQEELQREGKDLKNYVSSLEQDRLQASSRISKTSLELYTDVQARRGEAVVKVERGMCQGCRLTLPVNEWQRVRSGALVQCSSCSRMLYLE